MIIEGGSHLSEKGKQVDIDDMEDVLDLLEDRKFNVPGHGEVNLTEFWKGDLDIANIRGSMLKTWNARVNAEDTALNLSAKTSIQTAQDEFPRHCITK